MLEELYQAHYKELTRYCHGICGDGELAQDMTQEVFIKAMQNVHVLEELSPQQRRAWLYKAVRNLVYDRLRRSAVETKYARTLEDGETYEADFGMVEMQELLWRLPPQDRALFQMRYLEDYSATELGEIFDVAPSSIRARLSRIRKKLLVMLAE